MQLSTKLFGVRYIVKVGFLPERHIRWLPAIFWAKVGPATVPKEKGNG